MVHLADLLDRIPQSHVVSAEDKARWLAGVMKHHGARAEWHVHRLFGFGGSEMGALIRHMQDLGGGGFTTAERIVQQKLLKRLPEFETNHMRRGNVLEPSLALPSCIGTVLSRITMQSLEWRARTDDLMCPG